MSTVNDLTQVVFKGVPRIITAPQQPKPKVGQVWQNVSCGKLQTIYTIERDIMASFECEDGSRFGCGFGWLDGINYRYIGTINVQ